LSLSQFPASRRERSILPLLLFTANFLSSTISANPPEKARPPGGQVTPFPTGRPKKSGRLYVFLILLSSDKRRDIPPPQLATLEPFTRTNPNFPSHATIRLRNPQSHLPFVGPDSPAAFLPPPCVSKKPVFTPNCRWLSLGSRFDFPTNPPSSGEVLLSPLRTTRSTRSFFLFF